SLCISDTGIFVAFGISDSWTVARYGVQGKFALAAYAVLAYNGIMPSESPFSSHHDVIRLLDGPSALARCLGLEPVNTTVHWTTRGIPSRYWHRVIRLAAAKGLSLSEDQLERLPPRAA